MKYTGNTDPSNGARPGTERFIELIGKKWGFGNLGIWANRPMRGSNPPRLSVHATGRAVDAGLPKDKQNNQEWTSKMFDWFVANHEALGIEEVHQYWYKDWGRGFRCERKELGGKPGVKQWTESDNGGTPGGKWLHFELSPAFADDPKKVFEAWKSLKDKPE